MEENQNQNVNPQPIMQQVSQSGSPNIVPSRSKPVLGYIFGGMSFIPLIGVLFGIIAIIIGIIKKSRLSILLGVGGILLTVILYGSLFYFGFVAKTGTFADLKKQLAVQELNQIKGQVLIYKDKYNKLPTSLQDLIKLSPQSSQTSTSILDPWDHNLIYSLQPDGTFILKSSGPDGIPNTSDDIEPSL